MRGDVFRFRPAGDMQQISPFCPVDRRPKAASEQDRICGFHRPNKSHMSRIVLRGRIMIFSTPKQHEKVRHRSNSVPTGAATIEIYPRCEFSFLGQLDGIHAFGRLELRNGLGEMD